ncbi:MAG TPA: MlaD family protein [Fibrobacteria bacterium]|nr:MlaD family protein [Fibrobacteria bacterium]
MERYARLAGYSVALALLAGLLSIVSMLREGLLFPHNRVKVAFPAVGTLMEDDPVKLQGVQVGRVASIEAAGGKTVAVLEFFHRTPIARGSRFINYNYSLFGARMVILVPGQSREPIEKNEVQQGDFSTGVAETIHRVEDLLITVLEYKKLSSRLEKGSDTSLSIQQLLATKVYPVLEEFGAFTRDLEAVQDRAGAQLDRLTLASARVDGFGRDLSSQSDTLVLRANRTLAQLAALTAQSTVVLKALEEIALACQDTTKGTSRFLVRREMYDHALSLTHALQDLLKVANKDGLTDVIHFWRNVRIQWGKPAR